MKMIRKALLVWLLLPVETGVLSFQVYSPLSTRRALSGFAGSGPLINTVAFSAKENDNIADAAAAAAVQDETVVDKEAFTESSPCAARRRFRDMVRETLQKLAKLSLEDYKWRSSVFKSNEADRLIEESLARMRGEDPSYVRPMDASEGKIGILGRAEKAAVGWLSQVIEEEGKRAEQIASSQGSLVRPVDSAAATGESGPLATLEQQAVDFIKSIKESENERWLTGVARPKDLSEEKRGPLGELEASAVLALEAISQSEIARMEQSRSRGGEVVRPIDVPGPLGEFERKVLDIFEAERERTRERASNEGKLVRPKDARVKGLLGDAEAAAIQTVARLNEEERERLRNVLRFLEENRPMATDRLSLLGLTEVLIVGILSILKLTFETIRTIGELLLGGDSVREESEKVAEADPMLLELKLPDSDEVEKSKDT